MVIIVKLYRFISLFWLVSQLFFVSCAHQKNEPVIGLDGLSASYFSKNSDHAVLKLNYYEIIPYYSQNGFVWDAFNLPILSNYEISESDLLLGYKIGQDNFVFPPLSGSCKVLQKIEKYAEKKKKLISFMSAKANPEEDADNIFLLLDSLDKSPFALVKLNSRGGANCYLPNSSYYLSYNFGSNRQDFLINTGDKNPLIKIYFSNKWLLKINPIRTNNIQNGDLIRIGRKFEVKKNTLNAASSLIPIQIENDLFKPSNFQSQKLGADETFQTTFLISQTPFDIRLDFGNYVIAVVRKNVLVCLKEIEIHENKSLNLECPKIQTSDLEEKIFSRNDFNVNFDATFYPERLNQESHFQQWFLSNAKNYMPILFQDNKVESSNLEEKKFSFLFYSPKNGRVREFPENFTLKINDKDTFLPVFGTGLQNIVQGAIPFSTLTSLQFQYPIEPNNILSNSFLKVTNGTEIKLFEPRLSTDGVLTSITEQRFRFRVSVPSWNSTDVVEMDIDGKLHRRWILNRGDLSQPFSVTLDEKTNQEKDFVVRFTARGSAFLPDFIFGSNKQIPYARTRDYFVTIAGK